MKIYIYAWAILTSVTIISCKKENTGETPKFPPNYWGEASAQKNGIIWKAAPVCQTNFNNNNTSTIEIDSFINGSFLTESLMFQEVPLAIGTYDVFKSTGVDNGVLDSHLYFWESDVPLGLYHVLEGFPNQLTISSYDTTSKEIKGAFTLTLLVDHRPYPGAPDTIRFTNGQFHGRLYK